MSIFDKLLARSNDPYEVGVNIRGRRVEIARQVGTAELYIVRFGDIPESEVIQLIDAVTTGKAESSPDEDEGSCSDNNATKTSGFSESSENVSNGPKESVPTIDDSAEDIPEDISDKTLTGPEGDPQDTAASSSREEVSPLDADGSISSAALNAATTVQDVVRILRTYDPEAGDLTLFEYLRDLQSGNAAPALKGRREAILKKAIDEVLGA